MLQAEVGRGSGGELCWRATRRGLPGWNSSHRGLREGSRFLPQLYTAIGTIDSLMPEKTHVHGRCCRRNFEQAALEVLWCAVVERRVQPSAIVIAFDKLLDVGLQIGPVAVPASVNLLLFERLDEAFALGVVVRVSGAAHAGHDAMLLEQGGVDDRGVLHAAVGVVDQT